MKVLVFSSLLSLSLCAQAPSVKETPVEEPSEEWTVIEETVAEDKENTRFSEEEEEHAPTPTEIPSFPGPSSSESSDSQDEFLKTTCNNVFTLGYISSYKGDGISADLGTSIAILNAGLGVTRYRYGKLEGTHLKAYLGFGFGQYLQLQSGLGGDVTFRLRSVFPVRKKSYPLIAISTEFGGEVGFATSLQVGFSF